MKVEFRFWKRWKEAKKRAAYAEALALHGKVCANCAHCTLRGESKYIYCNHWAAYSDFTGFCHNWRSRFASGEIEC